MKRNQNRYNSERNNINNNKDVPSNNRIDFSNITDYNFCEIIKSVKSVIELGDNKQLPHLSKNLKSLVDCWLKLKIKTCGKESLEERTMSDMVAEFDNYLPVRNLLRESNNYQINNYQLMRYIKLVTIAFYLSFFEMFGKVNKPS